MKSFIVNKIIGLIILACVVFFPFQAYAASAHGHIRAALATLDKIKALSEEAVADPQDEEEVEGKRRLQYLKSFFFNGNLPYEAKTKAFVSGAVLPDILNMIVGWAGKFPHYGDTSFFYTLLVAEAAKPDSNGNVNEENVAFALGALTHYMADKLTHPIVNEFSGNVYGENANHSVVKWDYNTGKALRDVDGNPQVFLSDGGENKELHVFLECWLSKDILTGVSYNNPTLLLANELKYYDFDDTFRVSASQVNLVINTYKKLWNAGGMGPFGISQFNITTFDDKMGEFINSVTKAHSQGVQLERSFVQWALTDLPPIVLPTAVDSANFQDELIKIGELNGVNYSSISLRFLDALDEQSPKEAIEILKHITPFMEDKVLENITVNDTRLQNINLDNGQVSTYKNNNDHHVPEIYKDVNPDKTKAYIANQGGVTLKSIEIQDNHLSSQPDVTVDSNPQAVVFDPTGRFAWVANKGTNTISWVDTFKNKEIDQNRTDNISFTRLQVGSDPVALAITPDGSLLCVANNGSRSVSIIDVARRELVKEIPDVCAIGEELKDIKIDPQGKYAFVSIQKNQLNTVNNTYPGDIKKIDLRDKTKIYAPNENISVTSIIKDPPWEKSDSPRGFMIAPDGKELYLTDKGKRVDRPNYFHNLDLTSAPSADNPVSSWVGNTLVNRLETIDTQFYWCSVFTAPDIIGILVGITDPPGIYSFVGGYEDLPSMTTSLVGLFPFSFGFIFDLPWMITLTYKTDPLWLRQGVNVDIPAIRRYTDYSTDFLAAYTSFGYTGNIGIYDREKKEFFAATRSVVGDEYMSRPYNRYEYLKASTIGDIIALDKYKNRAIFYPGKKIYQVLSEPTSETLRRPIDYKYPWEDSSRLIVSPGFIGGLNKPTGVDIQPMVYSPMPLIGKVIVSRTENGAQMDYMIFSPIIIREVKIFDSQNQVITPNGNIEWAQKHDRFWELIIKDTTTPPFNCAVGSDAKAIDLGLEVTLDNGAVVSMGSSPAVNNIVPPPSVNLDFEGVGESQEETKGGFVMLNDDDDDKDSKADNDLAQPRPVANEDDLVKLTIHKVEPAAYHQGTVKLKITAGADKIKIWDSQTKNNEIDLSQPFSTPTGLPKELWVEGVALSGTAKDVELVLEYTKDGKTYEDKIKVTVLKVNLVPDYNHDGEINNNDKSLFMSGGPFHFWVNDDDDNGNEASGDSDRPGHWGWGTSPADYSNAKVDGRCDLLDFFPVWLDLNQILSLLPPSGTVQYKLKQANGAVKAVYTDLTKGQAGSFLTTAGNIYGSSFNQNSYEADTFEVTSSGVALLTDFLNKIKNDATKGILLIEGASATTSPLVLEIWKDGAKICEKEMPLKLSGVEAMYRWINLRPSGGLPTSTGEPANNPDALSNGKNVFFMHGFNVDADAARDWNAEIFKRLYQSGSRAKFWGMTWEGDVGLINALHYQDDVANALTVSSNLNAQISGISGTKIILGHSLGNMVVSSSIQDYSLSVDKYFMLDAAVATECYDPTAFNDATSGNYMLHTDWSGYNANTWCSKWFELFSSPDDRAKLTWKDRFPAVLSVAYNFYSSGDEIFEVFSGTPGSFTGGLFHLERYAWQKQEMLKGRGGIGGTDWAGWSFAGHWEETWVPEYTMAQANAASNAQLQTNAVFLHEPAMMFSSNITTQVVNDIIAKGVPALSYAAGVNAIEGFVLNYDANVNKPNGWGRDDDRYHIRWLHSDLKNMAYFYTHDLFDQIVSQGELK